MAEATLHRSPAARADMPAEPTQARRFGKARKARSATLTEDYVELIADLHAAHGEARATEIAKAVREAFGFVADQFEHAVEMMAGAGHE